MGRIGVVWRAGVETDWHLASFCEIGECGGTGGAVRRGRLSFWQVALFRTNEVELWHRVGFCGAVGLFCAFRLGGVVWGALAGGGGSPGRAGGSGEGVVDALVAGDLASAFCG